MTPKPKMKKIAKYRGDGSFYQGIPARDLSEQEWAALSPDDREMAADLYAMTDVPVDPEPEVLPEVLPETPKESE